MAMQRLRQILQHLTGTNASVDANSKALSIVHGPKDPPLVSLNLGQLLEQQVNRFPDHDAIVVPWTGARLTFQQLYDRSKDVARGLLALGIASGDRVAILSGNCEQFVELFFACGEIGAILVVLNPAYTPFECENTMRHAGCKLFFITTWAGRQSTLPLLDKLVNTIGSSSSPLPDLEHVILIRGENPHQGLILEYNDVIEKGQSVPLQNVNDLISSVSHLDTCVFMYTSGTTGDPKAAMLTHHGCINDGRFIGDRLQLTEKDVICCPPPLHHGFGLMLGLLSSIPYGASIVFPSQAFDPAAALKAIVEEKCTGLHGVPTMQVAILQELKKSNYGPIKIRCGITAGSPVPKPLMEELQSTFGFPGICIIYGLTETSGSTMMSRIDDAMEEKLTTVGRLLPHASAKIIDSQGKIVPRGVRGEILISGYLLQKGYFRNPTQTEKAMKKDENGTIWIHSGDEATIDERDYCRITGRIKDIIIRGGENIYPFEIEQRLGQHPAVSQASVVGLKDDHYGEIVAAFIDPRPDVPRPSDDELKDWVRATLTRFKAPARIFWIGKGGVIDVFPATSSGKIKKVDLRQVGNKLIGMA